MPIFLMNLLVICSLLFQSQFTLASTNKILALNRTNQFLPKIKNKQKPIIIAMIDTGIEKSHPDLSDNIWQNPGESGLDIYGRNKSNNNIDDDNNGYIDDVNGWNFIDNNSDVRDRHGHGTHIAGILCRFSDDCKIMTLKYYDSLNKSGDPLANSNEAFKYILKMKPDLINFSGGGFGQNQLERELIRQASELGILVIAALGNDAVNTDRIGFYPASYDLENVLAVTAVDTNNQLLKTSNYHLKTINLAAPGENILSTLPGKTLGKMTGTSQATAFVSACAALILINSANKILPQDLKRIIINSSDLVPARNTAILNIKRALAMHQNFTNVLQK